MVRQSAYVHGKQQQRTFTIRIKVTPRGNTTSRVTLEGNTLTLTLFCYTHKLSTWSFLSISLLITHKMISPRLFSMFCSIAKASLYSQICACILHARPSLEKKIPHFFLISSSMFVCQFNAYTPLLCQTLLPPTSLYA